MTTDPSGDRRRVGGWRIFGVELDRPSEAQLRGSVLVGMIAWLVLLLALRAFGAVNAERAASSLGASVAGSVASAFGVSAFKSARHFALLALVIVVAMLGVNGLRVLVQA